jgi:hypothetical protein
MLYFELQKKHKNVALNRQKELDFGLHICLFCADHIRKDIPMKFNFKYQM